MEKLIVILTCVFVSVIYAKNIAGNVRIVAGKSAIQGQFPYQISIRNNSYGQHHCGGSIINSKWILTAAHCVSKTSPSDWFVFAGNISVSGVGDVRRISKFIVHPGYKYPPSHNNDIALIELEEDLQFSDNIQPVELETEDVGVVDCVVSGWGITVPLTNVTSDVLQYVDLITLAPQQCVKQASSSFAPDTEICTPTVNGGSPCSRDSGGPLVAKGRQIGVVSRGAHFCAGFPAIYTKVSAYIDWIQSCIN